MWSLLGRARRRHAGLGEFRRRLGHRCRAAEALRCPGAEGALRPATGFVAGRSGSRRCLHLERHDFWGRVCPMATGSPPTVKGSRFAMRPRRSLRCGCPGTSSMSPPGRGRSHWAARRAHGMLALSPRAVERLESYTPPWPLPKLFRLTSKGKLIEGVFRGETINTPSMLCVEDALDSLKWAESVGGLDGLVARSDQSLATIKSPGSKLPLGTFSSRGSGHDLLDLTAAQDRRPMVRRDGRGKAAFSSARAMARRLEEEGAAYDIASHRASPPGLRIWTGATVEPADVERCCCPGSTGPGRRTPQRLPSPGTSREEPQPAPVPIALSFEWCWSLVRCAEPARG